ncbi:MAG: hypothetical protein KF819_09245 [Labilithrix sp.]|nr:hypothetical protein [Labilithrix sp.]
MHDDDWEVRLRAFECLRSKGDARWTLLAGAALKDESDLVVATALECLVAWRARRWADRASKLLSSASELTRSYAAWAVGRLGGKRHLGGLTRRFRKVSAAIEGSALAEALFMLTKRPRYLEHLLSQVRSADPEIRAFTANSLVGVLNTQNFPKVLCALANAVSVEKSAAIAPHLEANLEIAVSNALDDLQALRRSRAHGRRR